MWPRDIEAMLACWLAVSPFVFGHLPDQPLLLWNDFLCAGAILVCSLAAYSNRFRYAHLLNLGVGAWLIGFGYVRSGYAAAPGLQNEIFVGLFLLMFAILPSPADKPPRGWQEWRRNHANSS